MSDMPERTTIAKCHPFRGDNFYVCASGTDTSATEYARIDTVYTRAQVEAMVAEERERIAKLAETFDVGDPVYSEHASAASFELRRFAAAIRAQGEAV